MCYRKIALTPFSRPADSAPRDESSRKRLAVARNVAGPREPHALELWMAEYAAQAVAQRADAVRLPEDHGVQRDRKHERLALALLDHLLELPHHGVHELQRVMMEGQGHAEIIGLERIGNIQQRPGARSHPAGLVV